MALRTMAAKLKQMVPAAVKRVFTSSRAPATSSSPPFFFRNGNTPASASIDAYGLSAAALLLALTASTQKFVKKIVEISRKNRRDDALTSCGAGFGLAVVTLSLGIHRLNNS